MNKYKPKGAPIQAIQMNIGSAPSGSPLFIYQKWGGDQSAKVGDWFVSRDGEAYTIDKDSFEQTYAETENHGWYRKKAVVWAERADSDGSIKTKEGATKYESGDWLVYNQENRGDGYAMSAVKFEKLYEPYAFIAGV